MKNLLNLPPNCRGLLLLLFCMLAPPIWAQSQEAPANESEPKSAVETPEQHIEAIEKRRQALEELRKDIAERLTKADDTEAADLRRRVELLGQTLAVLGAQISEWQRQQELDAQQAAAKVQLAKLQNESGPQEPFSILDLDHARERLAVESARVKLVRAKFDLTKQALEQAQRALDKVPVIAAEPAATEQPSLAKLERGFAEQQKILRELELRNEEKAFSAHEVLLQLLRKQIDALQQRAVFDDSVLKERLADINRLEFERNRDLTKFKDLQLKAQGLLEHSRRQYDDASLEDEKTASEIEARRLALEAATTQVEAVQRELTLLAQRKQLWQMRHELFSNAVEQQALPKWRKQADADLDSIQQHQATLKLWLTDWQSRLEALNSKLGYEANGSKAWYSRQQQQIQSIIETLSASNSALQDNRTLLGHLVDDINRRSSKRSLHDWLQLMMQFEMQHNSLLVWANAATIGIITFGLLYVLRWLLVRTLKLAAERKHFEHADELLNIVNRANMLFFLAIALYCASLPLILAPATEAVLAKVIKVVIAIQVAIWLSGFLRAWIFRILARRTKRDGASIGALSIMNFTGQVALWSVAALLILQNLGVDITALVAGLGIGGIAVALALQRILNDLFSSLSIVLDKPFMVGDFIVLGEFLGTVEHIGIKTTKLRSLTGEQIICANGDLLDTRIRNFKRMQERRVVFKLGVVYQTTYRQLQDIPAMLKAIVEATEHARFDRAHFFQYGAFSLDFEIVYYVLSSDYNVYMDAQQTINLEIYRQFQQAGIEFAYPTQSLFVANTQTV